MSLGWEAIRAEVLRRIRTRHWPPGTTIPTEEELAAEFGAARATVNRALRELAQSGILERKRRAGTRVTMLPVRKATLDIPVIRQEIEALGCAYAFRLLEADQRAAPPEIAERLTLPAGTELFWARTLHLADDRPFVLESRWLNLSVLPQGLPDLSRVSLNEWLVAHVSYALGDIAFSAEAANPEEAALMGIATGAALFITERTTWTVDAPITQVRLAHMPGYRLQTVV